MRLALFPRALAPSLLAAAVVATVVVSLHPATAAVAVAAVAQPSAVNTGVPDGASLRRVDGLLVLDRAGATYSNLDVHGRVRVSARGITLANSIVRGDASKVQGELVDCSRCSGGPGGFVLRDSTLVAAYPSAYQKGILGHDFTVLRSEITRTDDAVHVVGGNVTVQRSWLHDTFYVSAADSPFHKATHNDGVQVISGSAITVVENTISGNRNAALQVSQDAGPVSNVRFADNWSSGGGCTVNLVAQPRATMAGVITVKSNRFRHDTGVANCAIIWGRGVTVSYAANVWSDTGKPVVPSRGY